MNDVKCPKCGSTSLHSEKKGFNSKKGILGYFAAGTLGTLWGSKGEGKVEITCLKCGNKFAPETTSSKIILRRFIVFNRLFLAILLIGLGLMQGFYNVGGGWWVAWIPMLVAILMIVAHFMIGPMSLIQGYVESGDLEGAESLLKKVKYPKLLYKPVRSSYHMLQANMHTMTDDLDKAETSLRKSLEAGITEKGFEGTAYLQLGAIAQKKGNIKEAYENIRKAIKLGLPDADNEASAYLQLSSICIQRRDFRASKQYFAKAKSCKATNVQIVDQIKEMQKYIARMPG